MAQSPTPESRVGEKTYLWSKKAHHLSEPLAMETKPGPFGLETHSYTSRMSVEQNPGTLQSPTRLDKKDSYQGVRLPFRASPALSPDGNWVAYGLDSSEGSDKIWFTKLDGSKTVSYDSGLVACGEPALIKSGSRILLAFTALPNEGSDWRKLHVVDVTSTIQ